jgi:acetoin utilization protein AcuC
VDKPAVLYSERYLEYDFGEDHAFQNIRIQLAYELMRSEGVVDGPADAVAPEPAAEEDLLLVHEPRYVDAVKELSAHPRSEAYEWGLGPGDNPIFPGMYDAAALQVGGTIEACEAVAKGRRPRGYNLGGGFHHAMPARASGFCIFNDVAVGLARLLKARLVDRVLYLDIDAHHGDGVQEIFYDDPRVLTVSLHEDGRFLFPGTGFPEDVGRGKGKGYAANVPLPPYTRDASYLYAFEEIVPPLARAYAPDLIFTQTGADAYFTDPLAHLKLTTRTYEGVARTVAALSKELCGGRWASATGGGYDMAACARVWTLIAATMAGVTLPDGIDPGWRELCQRELGLPPPATLRDEGAGSEEGVSTAVKEVVADVKRRVFPHHGITARQEGPRRS